jgi:hypothetical protein
MGKNGEKSFSLEKNRFSEGKSKIFLDKRAFS